MTGHDLRSIRDELAMTQAEFGEWLAAELGRPRPYHRQYISQLEIGHVPIPAWWPIVIEAARK